MIVVTEKHLLNLQCKKCHSKLQYEASDLVEKKSAVHSYTSRDYSGSSDTNYTQDTHKVLVCPVCHNDNIISTETKPFHYRF